MHFRTLELLPDAGHGPSEEAMEGSHVGRHVARHGVAQWRKGVFSVFGRRNAAASGFDSPLDGGQRRRCGAVHLPPLHQLLFRLALLLFRPQIRSRHRPRERDDDLRRNRRRTTLAPRLRPQHHLHRLAPGQLLPRRSAAHRRGQAPWHRVRPHSSRLSAAAGRRTPRRRVCRRRRAIHVDADH